MENMSKVDNGLNWLDKALQLIDKYRIATIFKGLLILLIVALTVGFINDPTYIFRKYKEYEQADHERKMELSMRNHEKLHILCEKLMYKTEADRVMILTLHNGNISNGGIPFTKCTATIESINEGIYPVASQYQETQLSLMPFVNHLFEVGYWCGDTEQIKSIDRGLYYKMMSNGTEHFAACVIEGVDKPLAFLLVSFADIPEHQCEEVRENIRHIALETALLLEINNYHK